MIADLSPAEIRRYYGRRVAKLHKSGGELRGPCPIHHGQRDSFSVNAQTGEWYCHSRCDRGGDIVGFEMAISGLEPKEARKSVLEILGRANGASRRIVAEYSYTDENGKLLYQCVRYSPKGFSQRRPDGRGGWVPNLKGVRRVLYRLPAILAASTVWIAEGEKDCEALVALGLQATTCPMGAGKWRSEYSEWLRGKEVFIIPDADEAGRKHAATVVRSLNGVATSAKLLPLPGAKDAAEWIFERGGTLEMLMELVQRARQSGDSGHPAPKVSDADSSVTPADEKRARRGFAHSAHAIFWIDEEADVRIFVCSELGVEARTCDLDGDFWGRLLVWPDGHGHQHRIAVPMALFAGDGVALREILLSGGVEIGAGRRSRELLSQYIQSEHPERSCTCVPCIGWCGRVFVFPNSTIPETNSVLFQARERMEHAWRTAGTNADWVRRIGSKCINNTRLTFAASMPFGAAVARQVNVEGGGVHLTGDTSTGKTTAQAVAASVCGGGGRGFVRSWRATTNALESIAELSNDSLLVLDELSEMPDPAQVNAAVYMLSNGQGKARATASAALRPTRTWQLLFLSSGEISLSEHAQAARARTRGGGEVRLLNVPSDAGAGKGLFEDLHGAASAREFADQLKAAAGEVYGTPLRMFLERSAADWDANCAKVRQSHG
jgi:hypothetical protein